MKRQGAKKPRLPGSLKEAETALIAACGGLEAAHRVTLISTSQLGRYTDPHDEFSHMPVHIVRALEVHCGQPIVLEYLAACEGLQLVRVAQPDVSDAKKLLVRALAECGRFVTSATAALGNGAVESGEAGKLLSPAMTLAASMGMLTRVLTAMVGRVAGGSDAER